MLGRTTQQQALRPSPLPTGLANEVVQDDWAYDPANGIGALANASRRRGTSAIPGSNPVTWSESYGYDSAARPSSIVTTIAEGAPVTFNSGMSYDALGRPNTHSYPDGLVVQSLYGPYGHAGGIADYSTGQIWYEVSTQDAWGKPTRELYQDGTIATAASYASSGQQKTASWSLNSAVVDALAYGYDSFGNLVSQKRTAGSTINTESYGYDTLQRLTSTSRSGGSVSYGYSASGNLKSKSDFGASYGYGSNGCGPHAVSAAGSFTYACDANGNVYGGNSLSIQYDASNHPRTASRIGAGSTNWAYDVNGGMAYESSSRGIRYFAPGGYEQVGGRGIHELGPIVLTRNGGVDTVTSTLRDRLGSTIDTIDAGFASSANTRNYDAFGATRNGDMSVRPNGTLNLTDMIHGFTKHDHADDVWLTHMGGRIYDYNLGRFLNVDPIIGNPLSSQSLNPYSYIGNNPLSGTDPTGYFACDAGKKEDNCSIGVNEIGKIQIDKKGNVYATTKSGDSFKISSGDSVKAVGGFLSYNGWQSQSVKGQQGATNDASNILGIAQRDQFQFQQLTERPESKPQGDASSGAVLSLGNTMSLGLGSFMFSEQDRADVDAFDQSYGVAAAIIGVAAGLRNPAAAVENVVKKAEQTAGISVAHQAASALTETGQRNIRTLRGWAESKGWSRVPGNGPETWGISGKDGSFSWRLKIKPEAGTRPGLGGGSRQPRFDARTESGVYVNPFTGKTGGREIGTHLPLEQEWK